MLNRPTGTTRRYFTPVSFPPPPGGRRRMPTVSLDGRGRGQGMSACRRVLARCFWFGVRGRSDAGFGPRRGVFSSRRPDQRLHWRHCRRRMGKYGHRGGRGRGLREMEPDQDAIPSRSNAMRNLDSPRVLQRGIDADDAKGGRDLAVENRRLRVWQKRRPGSAVAGAARRRSGGVRGTVTETSRRRLVPGPAERPSGRRRSN
jgi:hypothetical protein